MAPNLPPSSSPQFTNQAVPVGHTSATPGHGLGRSASNSHMLRKRLGVHYAEGTAGDRPPRPLTGQRLRIQQIQKRWERIKDDLPPQLTRRHIGMISMGGVIGTGLFLGSGAALHNGGPVGALIGYCTMGSVVYCLCVSIGEMIAFLPNVGGVVGLADLYVDPALGFSLGWAAWYNWSVTLPTEITAAAVVVGYWDTHNHVPVWALSMIFLAVAILINCFSSRIYGEFEFFFSGTKVLTIVCIIVVSIVIDLGAGHEGVILFSKWKHPFADSYLGIQHGLGRFLGFWAVLMQASFSFFGSEVPGIAAGEVVDATRNVPRALRRVWIRISLFYVGSVFCAGLLVDRNDPALTNSSLSGTVASSPFVIAFRNAGIGYLAHVINAAVLLSAWSAAASDIYISSRFLFFLSRCGHAPQIFASLFRYPRIEEDEEPQPDADEEGEADEEEEVIDIAAEEDSDVPPILVEGPDDDEDGKDDKELKDVFWHSREGTFVSITPVASSSASSMEDVSQTTAPRADGQYSALSSDSPYQDSPSLPSTPGTPHTPSTTDNGTPGAPNTPGTPELDVEQGGDGGYTKQPWFVLPLYAVLGSASVGLLSFLGTISGQGAQVAFNWLVAVASIASLQSWAGMLFTYIRWYQGTMYAWEKHIRVYEQFDKQDVSEHPERERIEEARTVIGQIKKIKEHRHDGQPYLAWWAFGVCMVILFTNGWSVFLHTGWRIADIPDRPQPEWAADERPSGPISIFLSSYIPIPFFLLLTFGYKLIHQTKMIRLEEMDFSRGNFKGTPVTEDPREQAAWRRLLGWLLLV